MIITLIRVEVDYYSVFYVELDKLVSEIVSNIIIIIIAYISITMIYMDN